MKIHIAYAARHGVYLSAHEVAPGSQAMQAIAASGMLQQFPDIDLQRNKIGIYGRLITPETIIQAGDRIEIYEPVPVDPKQARRERAKAAGKT